MKKLTLTKESFCEMLGGIIASGVSFTSEENAQGKIEVTFTGGY